MIGLYKLEESHLQSDISYSTETIRSPSKSRKLSAINRFNLEFYKSDSYALQSAMKVHVNDHDINISESVKISREPENISSSFFNNFNFDTELPKELIESVLLEQKADANTAGFFAVHQMSALVKSNTTKLINLAVKHQMEAAHIKNEEDVDFGHHRMARVNSEIRTDQLMEQNPLCFLINEEFDHIDLLNSKSPKQFALEQKEEIYVRSSQYSPRRINLPFKPISDLDFNQNIDDSSFFIQDKMMTESLQAYMVRANPNFNMLESIRMETNETKRARPSHFIDNFFNLKCDSSDSEVLSHLNESNKQENVINHPPVKLETLKSIEINQTAMFNVNIESIDNNRDEPHITTEKRDLGKVVMRSESYGDEEPVSPDRQTKKKKSMNSIESRTKGIKMKTFEDFVQRREELIALKEDMLEYSNMDDIDNADRTELLEAMRLVDNELEQVELTLTNMNKDIKTSIIEEIGSPRDEYQLNKNIKPSSKIELKTIPQSVNPFMESAHMSIEESIQPNEELKTSKHRSVFEVNSDQKIKVDRKPDAETNKNDTRIFDRIKSEKMEVRRFTFAVHDLNSLRQPVEQTEPKLSNFNDNVDANETIEDIEKTKFQNKWQSKLKENVTLKPIQKDDKIPVNEKNEQNTPRIVSGQLMMNSTKTQNRTKLFSSEKNRHSFKNPVCRTPSKGKPALFKKTENFTTCNNNEEYFDSQTLDQLNNTKQAKACERLYQQSKEKAAKSFLQTSVERKESGELAHCTFKPKRVSSARKFTESFAERSSKWVEGRNQKLESEKKGRLSINEKNIENFFKPSINPTSVSITKKLAESFEERQKKAFERKQKLITQDKKTEKKVRKVYSWMREVVTIEKMLFEFSCMSENI